MAAPPPETSVDRWIAVGFAIAFLALVLPGLAQPAQPIFDEVLHVVVAAELARGVAPSDFAHPPLARLLIALGMILGPGPFDPAAHSWTPAHAFAWRLPSALAMATAVGLLYSLGRSLFATRTPAMLAAGLLALDSAIFVHARMGMTNAFALAFIVAATAATWRAVKHERPAWLWAAGVALGLALATRWTGVLAWAALLTVVVVARRPWRKGGVPAAELRAWLPAALGGYFVLPPILYLASFIPFVLLGPEPAVTRLADPENWWAVVTLNQWMYNFHQQGVSIHHNHSPWWSWPLMLKPLWYHFVYVKADDTVVGVWMVGNPALWWAAVPALALAAWRGIARRDAALAFVAWMGLALWLAWGLTARNATFMTYFLESLPFAALAIAGAVQDLPRARWRTVAAVAYAGLAATWLVWQYPLLTDRPVPVDAYVHRMWLPRWEALTQLKAFRTEHGLLGPEAYKAYLSGLGNPRYGLGGAAPDTR